MNLLVFTVTGFDLWGAVLAMGLVCTLYTALVSQKINHLFTCGTNGFSTIKVHLLQLIYIVTLFEQECIQLIKSGIQDNFTMISFFFLNNAIFELLFITELSITGKSLKKGSGFLQKNLYITVFNFLNTKSAPSQHLRGINDILKQMISHKAF